MCSQNMTPVRTGELAVTDNSSPSLGISATPSQLFAYSQTCFRLAQVSKNIKKFMFFYLVRPVGIEPTTLSLKGSCSTD